MNLVCENCEEPLTGPPHYHDGRVYCCPGCAAGGPCTCTYQQTAAPPTELFDEPAGPQEQTPSIEAAGPPAQSQAPPEAQTPAEAPQPYAQSAPPPTRPRSAIVRVGGFEAQIELLQFAGELEQQLEIEDIALVRSDLEDAWFEVRVASGEQLARAFDGLRGFAVAAEPAALSVDATARSISAPAEEPGPEEEADLLPARQRYRIFRRPDEPAVAPPPEAPATERARRFGEPAPPAAAPPAPAAPSEPQPIVAAQAQVASETIAPEARPGGAAPLREHVTLVVYPFHSFVALNHFQDAVRDLHGIMDAKVRRFYRGTLHLAVDYEDVIPLTERLDDLEGFSWQTVSESSSEIELMLREEADLA